MLTTVKRPDAGERASARQPRRFAGGEELDLRTATDGWNLHRCPQIIKLIAECVFSSEETTLAFFSARRCCRCWSRESDLSCVCLLITRWLTDRGELQRAQMTRSVPLVKSLMSRPNVVLLSCELPGNNQKSDGLIYFVFPVVWFQESRINICILGDEL